MPIVDESIVIPAPPEAVFDYLDDPANITSFQATVMSAELEGEGPVSVGSRVKGTSKVLGRTFDWSAEVTEHDRPRRWASKTVEGKIPFTLVYTCEAEDEGTRLRYHLEAPAGLGGVFGRLADALVNKAYTRQVRADLATLAEILTEHGDG
ncbi:SRPBCC family protein [Sinomonas sp. ASV322]|uniref:SRPBCC family protein n=1 Tax=Sinomonas sp. ASV322 TaxID=3041920 RepID=UPI0027DE789C|nr:SRPBCC family protein [Sinomonas sp. ASV322]MDQ4504514.1 SRPBCC family protein [Sinomonas sp. ASV322]